MNRRDFANVPEAIAQARHFATESLQGAAPGVPEVVGLMVSELATDCVRHTSSEFSVEIEQTAAQLTVRVTDSGPGEPALRTPGPNEPAAWMRLVEDLPTRSASTPLRQPLRETVWFRYSTRSGNGRTSRLPVADPRHVDESRLRNGAPPDAASGAVEREHDGGGS